MVVAGLVLVERLILLGCLLEVRVLHAGLSHLLVLVFLVDRAQTSERFLIDAATGLELPLLLVLVQLMCQGTCFFLLLVVGFDP